MDEVEVKRAELKEETVREKGWHVPSLPGKGLDKAPAEDKPEEG